MKNPERQHHREFIIKPQEPVRFSLGDDALEFSTLQGTHIAEVTLVPSWGISVRNHLTGHSISFPFGVPCRIGSTDMPPGFFADNGKYISADHLTITMLEKNPDGSIRIEIADAGSTNGTVCSIRGNRPAEHPASNDLLIANNRDGTISTPDGTCSAITDKGARENNEDGVLIAPGMIALADGMGGESFGELASFTALETVRRLAADKKLPLKKFFTAACNSMEEQKIPRASGTTLAIARKKPLSPGKTGLEVGHVGDSKILVISLSRQKILFESTDQSRVQKMLERNILEDPIERYQNNNNSIITNAVSAEGLKEEPQTAEIEVTTGDNIIILCSDGVSDFVTPEEILHLACRFRSFCPRKIIDLAFSRHNRFNGFSLILNGQKRHVDTTHSDNLSVAFMLA